MRVFQMYVANTHGKRLSGFTNIEAADFQTARSIFRVMCDKKGIDRRSTELLALHSAS